MYQNTMVLEKLSLAYALDYEFNEKITVEKNFLHLMEVAEKLVEAMTAMLLLKSHKISNVVCLS